MGMSNSPQISQEDNDARWRTGRCSEIGHDRECDWTKWILDSSDNYRNEICGRLRLIGHMLVADMTDEVSTSRVGACKVEGRKPTVAACEKARASSEELSASTWWRIGGCSAKREKGPL